MSDVVRFHVEQAGCESCVARVESALAGLLTIEEIAIDEEADAAAVRARAPASLDLARVETALAEASSGSGHTYRVKPGTWRPGG